MDKTLHFFVDLSVEVVASSLTRNPDSTYSCQLKIDGLLNSVSDEKGLGLDDDEIRAAVERGDVKCIVLSGSVKAEQGLNPPFLMLPRVTRQDIPCRIFAAMSILTRILGLGSTPSAKPNEGAAECHSTHQALPG